MFQNVAVYRTDARKRARADFNDFRGVGDGRRGGGGGDPAPDGSVRARWHAAIGPGWPHRSARGARRPPPVAGGGGGGAVAPGPPPPGGETGGEAHDGAGQGGRFLSVDWSPLQEYTLSSQLIGPPSRYPRRFHPRDSGRNLTRRGRRGRAPRPSR
eukprot:6577571-Pyramimonas_sp.AAC.2